MALKTISGKLTDPSGVVASPRPSVSINLSQSAMVVGTQEVINSPILATMAPDGTYSVQLQANNDLTPANTYYTVTEYSAGSIFTFTIIVPQTAGPFVMSSIAVVPPAPLFGGTNATLTPSGALAVSSVTAVPPGSIGPYAKKVGLADGFMAMPYGASSGVTVGPTMINLQARGADMSGAVAADAIWAACLADLPSAGGTIYAPPGLLKTHVGFDSPAQGTGFLRFVGDGRDATKIFCDAAIDHVVNLRMPGEVCDMKVDGNALALAAALYMTTSGSIAIPSMAARRVSVGNIHPTLGLWTLAVWDQAQVYQIKETWLDDVLLYGPTRPSFDGFAISYLNHCFVKNMVMDGVGRPNFYCARRLEVDGLRILNSPATDPSVYFDALLDRLQASHVFCDSAGQGVGLNCADARFEESTFENLIIGPSGTSKNQPKWAFHNCHGDLSIQLLNAIESLEIVGGEWGAMVTGSNGVITDFSPAGTHHKLVRISDATVTYICVASNAITIDELSLSDCSFWMPGRVLNDATVNGTTTLTSPTGRFTSNDVGRTVQDSAVGNKIPAGTTIASVTNATTAVMSAAATGTFSPDSVVLGGYYLANVLAFAFNGNTTLGAKSKIRGSTGYNPVGVVTPAVPASGVAVAYAPYDRTFYVTTAALGCTMAIQGGPSVVIPASSFGTVRVPAGQTVTPTYTNAPTWVVEGE